MLMVGGLLGGGSGLVIGAGADLENPAHEKQLKEYEKYLASVQSQPASQTGTMPSPRTPAPTQMPPAGHQPATGPAPAANGR